jgi:hypothetical protein
MSLVKSAGYFLIHFLIAFLGAGVLVAFGWHLVRSLLSPVLPPDALRREEVLVLPFFPLQNISAFLLGVTLTRMRSEFAKATVARWIWIIPLIWLLFVIVVHQTPAGWSMFSLPFQLRIISVLPFMESVFYALGHRMGMRPSASAASPTSA